MTTVAQGELVGNPFSRLFKVKKGEGAVALSQQRKVRVVAGLDDQTGEMVFKPAKKVSLAVSSLPHFPLSFGRIFDAAFQKPSIATALKHGASTVSVITNQGDPNYRPLKTTGFKFKSTPKEIAEERKRKLQKAQQPILYQDHP